MLLNIVVYRLSVPQEKHKEAPFRRCLPLLVTCHHLSYEPIDRDRKRAIVERFKQLEEEAALNE